MSYIVANVSLQERWFVAFCLGSIYIIEWDVFLTAWNIVEIDSLCCYYNVYYFILNIVYLLAMSLAADSFANYCCNVTSNAKKLMKYRST